MDSAFLSSDFFTWVILPLLIFLARVIDVSIGTLRIILVARGERLWAPLLGFFEVLVWILAVGQVMQNLSNVLCYVAYAGGFALGNYVGMLLEERLAMGILIVRIITAREADKLFESLYSQGFGATAVDARGTTGKVTLIYSVIRRKDLPTVVRIINDFDRQAFYSVEDARYSYKGIFPPEKVKARKNPMSLLRMRRKAK